MLHHENPNQPGVHVSLLGNRLGVFLLFILHPEAVYAPSGTSTDTADAGAPVPRTFLATGQNLLPQNLDSPQRTMLMEEDPAQPQPVLELPASLSVTGEAYSYSESTEKIQGYQW